MPSKGHRINAREGLIDLKNALDHNLPLMLGGRNIEHHVLHYSRNDESADRRGDDDRDAREAVGHDGSEGEPIGGGHASGEATSTQEHYWDADHCDGVRDTGDDRQMRDLGNCYRTRRCRVDSHGGMPPSEPAMRAIPALRSSVMVDTLEIIYRV
ncbi:MAG: hypothetical protein DMG80_12195 [Acidobacteria bacterium]|nr:MAG: hypothetical protein DMG80_12195 [Acidobacteriota bacterium]